MTALSVGLGDQCTDATNAQFHGLGDLALDSQGNAIIPDRNNHRIRKYTLDGKVMTIAGSGINGYQDGAALTAQFNSPSSVTVASDGTIYVADTGNHRIRKIDVNPFARNLPT